MTNTPLTLLRHNSPTQTQRINMKKITATLLVLAALATGAFAHHPSPSDSAGGNISDGSGHFTNAGIL